MKGNAYTTHSPSNFERVKGAAASIKGIFIYLANAIFLKGRFSRAHKTSPT
jgi:hypothetical protein